MIQVEKKENCCGCGACMNVCPKHCINMQDDFEGFLYPKVDEATCVNCGLCEKVCPILNPQKGKSLQDAYVLASKNEAILKESASGGFFHALASYVISLNGVVFGAAFDDKMIVRHQYSCNEIELIKFSGSKYVQSSIGNSYSEVKKFLKNGKIVLFSGTPCQIQGLYKYLGNCTSHNLITLDIVCHGVPSPAVLKKYFDYIETKYNSKIKDYKFRTKKKGYNSDAFNYNFCQLNNNLQLWGNSVDKYFQFMNKAFFAEIISRPSCAKCKFKNKDHLSDFTVFDCWHWKSLTKKIDGKKGATALVVNSSRGLDVLNRIANSYYLEKSEFERAVKLDGICMLYSVSHHPRRNEFFASLTKMTIPQLYDEFLTLRGKNKIKAAIRKFLDKVGLLSTLRNLKYRIKK